jgi:hypothetical protein
VAWFEVVYPSDVNDAASTYLVNLPASWVSGPGGRDVKTKNLTCTGNRDLHKISCTPPGAIGHRSAMSRGLLIAERARGLRLSIFAPGGISDHTAPWAREWSLSLDKAVSVMLFALD